jgi:hypothetical protein
MIETIVKVFLRDEAGNLDSFTTTINLPEQESHAYYLGRSWNMGVKGDRMMECYKVETVEAGHTISECARKVSERLSSHFASTSGGWNVPQDMPFMQEFLSEIRTLCDLCLRAGPAPELLAKISNHLQTLGQLDQHNELSMIFWDEQKRHKIDMQPWIDEWHACECDFAAWYAGLPPDIQGKVIDYYRKQKSL